MVALVDQMYVTAMPAIATLTMLLSRIKTNSIGLQLQAECGRNYPNPWQAAEYFDCTLDHTQAVEKNREILANSPKASTKPSCCCLVSCEKTAAPMEVGLGTWRSGKQRGLAPHPMGLDTKFLAHRK